MPDKKPAAKGAKKSARRPTTTTTFSEEERAAMRERAAEVKAARANAGKAEEEGAVLAKLAAMAEPDRTVGERLHAIVKANAPDLAPRLWYGMPAYAKDGSVLCFFQDAQKFKTRYASFGFTDKARLDDGKIWPTTFAITDMTDAVESKIVALVKRAVR